MSKSYAVRLILRLLVVVAMQQQQLLIYKRQIKRPKLRKSDRLFWVLCKQFFPRIWKSVLSIVRPDTVIRWHRDLARLRWKWISKHRAVRKNKIPHETAGQRPAFGASRWTGLQYQYESGVCDESCCERRALVTCFEAVRVLLRKEVFCVAAILENVHC